MDVGSIEETRKVSFDDLVCESMGRAGDDLSSVEGLVTVPEDYPVQSDPLPQLPAIYSSSGPPTPDLYSCFDPPRNPRKMRRRPHYPTIIAAPDYCSIYSSHNWRRVSFETAGSKRPRDEDDDESFMDLTRYKFHKLLRRFASSGSRSEESRSNILRHGMELSEALDLEKEVNELLSNDTRSQMIDMVRKELDHLNEEVSLMDEPDESIPDHNG